MRTLAPASIVAHPLTRGVTSLSALRGNPGPYAGGNQAKPGTAVVAAWAQLNARGTVDPAIAYRQTGAACVIHIGIAPQYGVLRTFSTYGTDFGGDFYKVWANAFAFAAAGCRAVGRSCRAISTQIGDGWANRAELDFWRAAYPVRDHARRQFPAARRRLRSLVAARRAGRLDQGPIAAGMSFAVLGRCGAARRGRLTLAHGSVETPVFMPVGTYGTVKAMSPARADASSARRSSSATPSTCGCARAST